MVHVDGQDKHAASPFQGIDVWLLSAVVLLCAFGLLFISDATVSDSDHFLKMIKQVLGFFGGLFFGVFILMTPTTVWRRHANVLYWLTMILMALCLSFSPIGVMVNGANRWLDLGFMNIQPSELAKFALIVATATNLANNEGDMALSGTALSPVIFCFMPIALLAYLQTDLGTIVVSIVLVGGLMLIAGLRYKWVALFLSFACMGVFGLIMGDSHRLDRMTAYLAPFSDVYGTTFNISRILVAFQAGGITGVGLGNGDPNFVPESHTDYIGSLVAEQAGAIGWVLLVALYAFILYRALRIALNARSFFRTLVAFGVTALIWSHVVINLGGLTGTIPSKGLVLPFMSYGPTAMLVFSLMMALLLRVGIEEHASSESIEGT
jgi:cell division protein FtsW